MATASVACGARCNALPIAYNWKVDKPAIPNPPGKSVPARNRPSAERRRILRAEAIGIIVIAVFMLLYTVLRYGAHINWSAR